MVSSEFLITLLVSLLASTGDNLTVSCTVKTLLFLENSDFIIFFKYYQKKLVKKSHCI
jgi:hypothetical protein